MTETLQLKSLNHVALISSRVEESRAFYRDVLGFRELDRPKFDFDGAWLFNYGVMIHIIHGEAPPAGGPLSTRDGHLAFHADDVAAAEAALKQNGIQYRTNIVPERGIRQLFFRDPNGFHIEVGTYPPLPVAAGNGE